MKSLANFSSKKMRNFAHRTLKELGFVDLTLLSGPDHSAPELPPAPHPAGHNPPDQLHLQIPIDDWDALFRSIQVRLTNVVGDRPASALPLEAADTTGHIQVAVLDCVSALGQLHAALARERMNTLGAGSSGLSV
ncbi:hypothetical protein [Polaromonas sp.]|uniref:hypothetical protein n=1 Tax=Polaromonas sp. TaxID=1869339 RepID=UPI003C89F1BC